MFIFGLIGFQVMSSFHRPLRPEPKTQEPKEWYEEVLGKDELLLYLTAALGVILPGLVYLIYPRVHIVYTQYAAVSRPCEK